MKKGLIISEIRVVNYSCIEYTIEYHAALKKYFKSEEPFFVEYDIDISDVPESILIIPLLANILPISWFVGFAVFVDELDSVFINSIKHIKKEFLRIYPELEEKASRLIVKKAVNNSFAGEVSALLFSGGVDAYASYFRHYDKTPDLITIIGADIPLNDVEQQERVLRLNSKEEILAPNKKYIIKSNLRDFYTYKVSLLLSSLSWWGEVQHGMALIGVTAPLAFRRKYFEICIASTHTKKIQIPWGSAPYIDEKMRWADINVLHDGYELERIEKIDFIVQESQKFGMKPKLRVCYSEINSGINCSRCEKCIRTAFGIMLANDDPNLYGFQLDKSIFEKIRNILNNSFSSAGILHHWSMLIEELDKTKKDIFLFGLSKESKEVKALLNYNYSSHCCAEPNASKRNKARLKYILTRKFPIVYKIYLRLRHHR